MSTDLGERLATWLEDLGLADHLDAAGLPRLTRAPDGRAVWTDPGTGDDLSDDQLADLERLLRHEGSDPRHAVPVPLVQIAHQAKVRSELLASDWLTYETMAERRGSSVDNARFVIHKAAGEHRLLVVANDERTLVPAFQLTAGGDLRDDLATVLEPLLAARMDPWRVWSWLTQPAALLGGLVPEQASADPEAHDLVVHAAVRLAERVRSS